MYDIEKRSPVLENAAGETRCVYVRSHNKMVALGYAYTLRKQTWRSPKRCTSRNATGVIVNPVPPIFCIPVRNSLVNMVPPYMIP